ncbi:hypothetical protein PT7_0593 [Pusillimonas sp. T7-7]|nr:hypothetical protein PT7_0593 [Pusillimonas sp. T7-7]
MLASPAFHFFLAVWPGFPVAKVEPLAHWCFTVGVAEV